MNEVIVRFADMRDPKDSVDKDIRFEEPALNGRQRDRASDYHRFRLGRKTPNMWRKLRYRGPANNVICFQLPSGAPGSDWAFCALVSFLDTNFPNGFRAPFKASVHAFSVNAP